MAVRKPLVQIAGQVQQLQAGDSIAHPGLNNHTNNNAGAIVIGQPVYSDGAGVDLAQADALATAEVLGLVAETSIAAATPGAIQSSGKLTATTGEWDTVTGQVGGLTPTAKYFLDPTTAGMLTTTAPSVDGEVVAAVGVASSTTDMEINIDQTILL